MITDQTAKRVLILSDDSRLSKVMKVCLDSGLGVETIVLTPDSLRQQGGLDRNSHCDLIVVATSSPVNKPVAMLARTSLTEQIGRIPLLIISNRSFDADPNGQIVHLDFPFDADTLRDKVKEILRVA